jgi:hypothetical protein
MPYLLKERLEAVASLASTQVRSEPLSPCSLLSPHTLVPGGMLLSTVASAAYLYYNRYVAIPKEVFQ